MRACFEPHPVPSALGTVDTDGLGFARRGKTNRVNKTRVKIIYPYEKQPKERTKPCKKL